MTYTTTAAESLAAELETAKETRAAEAAGTVFTDAAELAQAYDPYPSTGGTELHSTAAKADTLLKRWAAMADALDDRISYN